MEALLLEILKWSWGALLPYLLWQHKRLDKLNQETIRREEFNGMVNSLRAEIRESTYQLTNRIDSLLNFMMEKK